VGRGEMALRVVGSSECLGLVKVGGYFGVFPDIIGEYLQLVGESTQNLWWESSALCERRVLVAAPNATSQPTSVGLLEHAHLRAAPRRTPTPSYCGGTRHVGTLQALDWVSSRCADRHAAVSLYPLLRRRVKRQSQPGRGGGGRGSARHGWRPVSTSVGGQYVLRGEVHHVAENLGLLAGLTACKQFGFSPIHVVGDSAMIIRQQATRTPPKAPHLRPLYWRCRRQLGGTQVLTWQHHFRAQNKMADSLANLAMDTQKSIQVRLDADLLRQPRWATLVGHAGGDIGHLVLHNMDMDSTGAAGGTR
jgi:ribonuclease HI